MQNPSFASYRQDPQFKLAMHLFQKGEWDQGLKILDTLSAHYALDKNLRTLKGEMRMRSRVDSDEQVDLQMKKKDRLLRLSVRALAVIALLSVVVWGLNNFGASLEEQFQATRNTIEQEVAQVELTVMMRDAQAFLQADRPQEALPLLEEIRDRDPAFPDLAIYMSQAQKDASLDLRYQQARQLMSENQILEAQSLLEAILMEAPAYRDVEQLLDHLEQQSIFAHRLTQAQTAFDAGQWEQAIEAYEELLTLVPDEQREQIEEHLYTAYINAAQAVLVNNRDSLAALTEAEELFREALSLRPQNPEIKRERDLARLYLDAQSDYGESRWTQVITKLEAVVTSAPEYANGTARQTLYEAYVARGDRQMNDGNYEIALADYQRAVTLAQQDQDAVLRLYESQVKTAEAQGELGHYEAAVLLFSAAVDLIEANIDLENSDPGRFLALQEAENYASRGNFAKAYEKYRFALHITAGNYCLAPDRYVEAMRANQYSAGIVFHTVGSEDYLTSLASRYQSTVCAIVVANNIEDPNLIIDGQELIIPVTP